MPRMNILNTVEQEAFEAAPVFNSLQRKQYFDFPHAIQQAAANLRTPANQLWFLLLCDFSFLKVDIKHLRESAGSRVLWLWPPNVRCGAGDIGFRMRLHLRPRTAGPIAAAGKQA